MKASNIRFGKKGLFVVLPDGAKCIDIIEPKIGSDAISFSDYDERIKKKLLYLILLKQPRVAIVIPDHTRACPTKELITPIIDVLNENHIYFRVIVGCGTHRKTKREEVKTLVPENALGNVVIHDFKDLSQLKEVGSIGSTPVLLNKEYVDANVKIVIGMIEPHFMAGFSGGSKGIIPGIAGWDTIAYAHSPDILSHVDSKLGNIVNNPVHSFISSAARLCPPDFCINIILDMLKKPISILIDSMDAVLEQGAAFYRLNLASPCSPPYDVVIASAGGYPLDATLYQAIKGLVTGCELTHADGVVYLFMEGIEGYGSDDFKAFFHPPNTWEGLRGMYESGKEIRHDQWQVQLMQKHVHKRKVYICSDALVRASFGPLEFLSLEDALLKLSEERGRVGVLPAGPYTYWVRD